MTLPKTCFNPTCKCNKLKIVREVALRCSNCHCGVKVEVKELKHLEDLLWKSKTSWWYNLKPTKTELDAIYGQRKKG